MDEIATIAAPDSTAVAEPTATETPTETPTPEPSTETPAGDTSTETPTETEEDELPGDPGDEEALETDARKLDEKTRKMVADLKKTNPAAAKELANQFFRRLAYEKEFPTVQDARQAKATIESLGGEEGISALQQETADSRAEMEQFANGDPALVETLYKANPESTVKMVEAALDIFAKNRNMDALDSVILRPMVQRLQQVGLHSHLVKAAELIHAGKGQEAYDTLGAIGEWLTKLTGDAEKMGTTRTVKDPREEQLTQREQRLQQQERENFDRAIGTEVNELNNKALGKVIGNFFKEVGLDHNGKREFTQSVLQKIWAAMREDKVFQRQARDIKSKGDKTYTAKFINAKFSELAPKIFRTHKNLMYPKLAQSAAKPTTPTNGKPTTPAKPAGTNSAAIQVAEAPAFDTVDWSKTDDMTWAKGFAHLKTGKYVYFH